MSKNIGTTSSGKPIHDADHKVYTETFRMPKWNIRPNALKEPKILKRTLPGYTSEDHVEAAEAHRTLGESLQSQHQTLLRNAEKKYGDNDNPYSFLAGGHMAHWPEAVKEKSRKLVRKYQAHFDAARAHEAATRFRPYSPRPGTGFARRR